MSVSPNFSNNPFLPLGPTAGLNTGTNPSTATALTGPGLQGGAFTSNPSLNSILLALYNGSQTGFVPTLPVPLKTDTFTPTGGQPGILPPIGAAITTTPPVESPTPPVGTPSAPAPEAGTPAGTPATPAPTPPTGTPTPLPVGVTTPPPVTPVGTTPAPGGATLQEVQAKALAQAQAPQPPLGQIPAAGNLLTSPTGGLPPAIGGNPLLGMPSPLGGNPLLGGNNGLGQILQVLVQLLLTLRQQPGGLPGAPGAPGTPTAPVDPEKEALKKKVDELEKKVNDQNNKKTDPAPAKNNDPAPAKPKDTTPTNDNTPAKSKESKDIDEILKNFTTIDKNGSGYLDASELSAAGYTELANNVDALMFATVSPGRDAYYGVNAGDLKFVQSRLDKGDSLSTIASDLKKAALDRQRNSPAGLKEATFEEYVAALRKLNP